MFDPGQKKARNKYAVEVELDDGKVQTLFLFVAPGIRVIDVLKQARVQVVYLLSEQETGAGGGGS